MSRCVAILLLLSPAALAQTAPEPAPEIRYPTVDEVIFDDEVRVEGELVGPRTIRVVERREAEFPPFFRLRTSFAPEILRSADEVR